MRCAEPPAKVAPTIVCYDALFNFQVPVTPWRRWIRTQAPGAAASTDSSSTGAPASSPVVPLFRTLPVRCLLVSGSLLLLVCIAHQTVRLPNGLQLLRKII